MKILTTTEDFTEMSLFNLGQKFPNAKLLRVEVSTWNNIYVVYEGRFSLKGLSKKLGLENLTKKHIIKNA